GTVLQLNGAKTGCQALHVELATERPDDGRTHIEQIIQAFEHGYSRNIEIGVAGRTTCPSVCVSTSLQAIHTSAPSRQLRIRTQDTLLIANGNFDTPLGKT